MNLKLFASLVIVNGGLSAQVLHHNSFENNKPEHGRPLVFMTANDARAERVVSTEEAMAADAVPGSKGALLLQGGAEPAHRWQPAVDVELGDQMDGYLYIGFQFRNRSFEAGTLGLQIANRQTDLYQVHQHIVIHPDYLKVLGSGRALGKGQITAGVEGKWTRVDWYFPLPKTPLPLAPRLAVEGKDQGDIAVDLKEDIPSINNIRIWLTTQRGEDIQFFLDNLVVLSAPTMPMLQERVTAFMKEHAP